VFMCPPRPAVCFLRCSQVDVTKQWLVSKQRSQNVGECVPRKKLKVLKELKDERRIKQNQVCQH